MAVNLNPPDTLLPVPGVRLATAAAGIRYRDRDDLALIELAEGTTGAAVFTRNAFAAAPVTITRERLSASDNPRAVLVNSGNANAGTGKAGHAAALAASHGVADALGIEDNQVWLASTGVIGECLPVLPVQAAIPGLVSGLVEDRWLASATAIMTTDAQPKGISRRIEIGGSTITVTGIAKGAGMIRPDMATMLAFVATDARVEAGLLQQLLEDVVDQSFNRISVDGDTSTNDCCYLFATGQSEAGEIRAESKEYEALRGAVSEVCRYLALAVVRDGEGASHVVEIIVESARDAAEARQVADTVAHSPLVKTAMFAADPNWGRILAAVGRSGIAGLDIGAVDMFLDDVQILADGEPASDYSDDQGQTVMQRPEYCIRIALHRGEASTRIWTCDFGHEYVRINAEYRT